MHNSHTSRPALAWTRVRDSLWFIPSLAVVFGSLLAMIAVQIPTPETRSDLARVWLFGGGVEGARGVLTAIAGSLITVTGTVFSVTIVALQLASSQFTPRVLGSFVADRVNQVVLGIFIGTFTYTLLVLRTIGTTPDRGEQLLPHIGVTIALVLLLVSVGALIVFINHAARSVQVSVILHREAERTLRRVDELFPEDVGDPAPGSPARDQELAVPATTPARVVAAESGYLQALHADALWEIGKHGTVHPITIRMEIHVGAFAFKGKPLASVWPAGAVDGKVIEMIRDAFVLGPERTPEQDVEFGLVEISDIGVRALSPGVNDPTTAFHSIDRLSEVLAALGSRRRPPSLRSSPDGKVHLLARATSYERALGLAFDQIRHFGAGNPAIAKKLLEAFADLAAVAPAREGEVLVAESEAVARQALRSVEDPYDRATLQRFADEVLATVRERVARAASTDDAS